MAQLNSLLVTGDSRFLNTINGDINGNAATATIASKLEGTYSGSGGQQPPNYFGRNKVGALMSNATVNGDSHYKNWLYMDNYNGADAGGATAIGIDRSEARAFIMQSDSNRTTWNNTAELATTTYITNQIGALDGVITGSAGAGKTLTAFSQTDGKVTATFGNINITKSQISDFPTIPSAANNGKLSIKLAGTEKASFTADQSGNSTANFTFTAGTTPSTVTKKTVVTSATFNTVVTGGTTTDVPNISKKTVVTSVTPATVVTGGTTTDIPNISKKTVVTGVTKKTVVTDATFNTVVSSATVANRKLTISTGVSGSKSTGDSCTVTTGDSVTVGTAIKAYTSLTTGDSCTVSTGDSVTVGTAIKAYTTLNTGVAGSAQTGDSVTVTAGTAPSLSIASS